MVVCSQIIATGVQEMPGQIDLPGANVLSLGSGSSLPPSYLLNVLRELTQIVPMHQAAGPKGPPGRSQYCLKSEESGPAKGNRK